MREGTARSALRRAGSVIRLLRTAPAAGRLLRPAVDPAVPAPARAILVRARAHRLPAEGQAHDPDRPAASARPGGPLSAVAAAAVTGPLRWCAPLARRHAARAYRSRYLAAAEFDVPARVLLARAQHAVDVVTACRVTADGAIDDGPPCADELRRHEWELAVRLRRLSRFRAVLAAPGTPAARTEADAARRQIAEAAAASAATRVLALESYAAEARAADAAYRQWLQPPLPASLDSDCANLLAGAVQDQHAVTGITALHQQARAARLAISDLAASRA